MSDPLEKSKQAFYLFRDAFAAEDFEVTLKEAVDMDGSSTFEMTVGTEGRGDIFTICMEENNLFKVVTPDSSLPGTVFSTMDQAVTYSCDNFNVMPSWEREKYPTIWQLILADD